MHKVTLIPIDSITPIESFKRTYEDNKQDEDLKRSIQLVGILQPLIVLPGDQGFILIAGWRRYIAARRLGLSHLPCIAIPAGCDDAEIIRLHENLYHLDISPYDEAIALARLEITYRYTRERIAQLVGRSKSYITQRIQILDWSEDIKELLRTKSLTYSLGRELSTIENKNIRKHLLHLVITEGATVRTIIRMKKELQENTEA